MRAAFAALVLLGACASPQPQELPAPPLPQRAGVDPVVAARAEGVSFLAHGEAPAFELRFYEDRITLKLASGQLQSFARPEPRYPRWNGSIHETSNSTHRLIVSIRDDRPCPETPGQNVVEVMFDAQELRGCGREI